MLRQSQWVHVSSRFHLAQTVPNDKALNILDVRTLVYLDICLTTTLVWWFVGFYGISTFVGYLTPNPFLCKLSVLLKTVQFSISTQFNCQKYFHFKLFKQLYVIIQLSVNTVLMSKNSSIWNNSVKHKHAV